MRTRHPELEPSTVTSKIINVADRDWFGDIRGRDNKIDKHHTLFPTRMQALA